MRQINNVSFKPQEEITVPIPAGAGLLEAHYEAPYVFVTYMADTEAPLEPVTFYVLTTMHEVPDTFTGRYFKTVRDDGRRLHLFFKPKAAPAQRGRPIVADPNGARASKRGNDNGGA